MEDTLLEKFDMYYSDQMDKSERVQFEQDLKSSEELRLEYESYVLTELATEALVQQDLREKMGHWKEEKKQSGRQKRLFWFIGILFLLGVIGGFLVYNYTHQEPDYAQYAQVYLEPLDRSNEIDPIKNINQQFLQGNYDKTKTLIEKLPEEKRASGEVVFIQGMIAYRHQQLDKALELFNSINDETVSFVITEQKEFMQALIQIQNKRCDQPCMVKLKTIASDGTHLKHDDAKSLLQSIR